MRITEKLLLVFLPIFLLSVVSVTLLSRRAAEQILLEDVSRSARVLGLGLSQSPTLVAAFEGGHEQRLLPVIQQMQKSVGAAYVYVISQHMRVVAHTDVAQKGRLVDDSFSIAAIAADQSSQRQTVRGEEEILDVAVPIWSSAPAQGGEAFLLLDGDKGAPARRLATLVLGVPLGQMIDTAHRISRQVLWIVTFVNLFVLGVSLFYLVNILRPVRHMAKATERIANGQLGETVPVLSRDEMGDLAHSFNRMSRDLALTTVSADFLDSVIDSMRDVLIVMNNDGSIRRVNGATVRLLGYDEGDLLGRGADYLFTDADGLFSREGLFDLERGEGVLSKEAVLCSSTAVQIPVLLSVTTFNDRDGRLAGYIATAADITERIKAEQATRRSLHQKEVLLKEIHHRVKNNLQVISSLLNLQSGQQVDQRTREVFSDSQSRIRAMSLIHEQLYQSQDLELVEFHDYITSLTMAQYQTHRREGQSIDLRVDAQDVDLGIDQAIPCGLIINELVANAIKHGVAEREKGIVRVRFQRQEDGRYRLDVTDDGPGLPDDFDWGRTETLGLRLVSMLTDQLKGEIRVEKADHTGTQFVLCFDPPPTSDIQA